MNKRTMQIDVIGPVEGTELMKCKLYIDGRVCVSSECHSMTMKS